MTRSRSTPATTPPAEIPGAATRLAALRLIDAVLRRGEPLDRAAPPLLRPVPRADDRALAMAIAQEVLRWLVRMAKDRQILTARQYEFSSEKLAECGKMVGGWRKQAGASSASPGQPG